MVIPCVPVHKDTIHISYHKCAGGSVCVYFQWCEKGKTPCHTLSSLIVLSMPETKASCSSDLCHLERKTQIPQFCLCVFVGGY